MVRNALLWITCKWYIILIIYVWLKSVDTPAQELSVSLQGPYACPGDQINFTCTTRSSTIQAWKSKQYIGGGAQLEFLSVDQPGTLRESAINPNASAVLVSVNVTENGITVIISTLSVVVSANLGDIHQVTCINVNTGTRETFSLTVAGPSKFPMLLSCGEP